MLRQIVDRDLTLPCLAGRCLAAARASIPAWAAQNPSCDADRPRRATGLCTLRSKVLSDPFHEVLPSRAAPAHTRQAHDPEKARAAPDLPPWSFDPNLARACRACSAIAPPSLLAQSHRVVPE